MNKDQHNHLLLKVIAIERSFRTGHFESAQRETLKIIARLITEIYEMQQTEED